MRTRWLTKYRCLSLQNKLKLCFLTLILLPSMTICIVYYSLSSQNILAVAQQNILDVVSKNTNVVDAQLSFFQTTAVGLNVNSDLFALMSSMTTDLDSYNPMTMDEGVKNLLSKSFSDSSIISANLLTPEFTFGDTDNLIIYTQQLFASPLYTQALRQQGNCLWLPAQETQPTYVENFNPNREYAFSLFQVLNPIQLPPRHGGAYKTLPPGSKPCALIFNFNSSSIHQVFGNSVTIPGAFYMVTSPQGDIIIHQDPEKTGSHEQMSWAKQYAAAESGSFIHRYNGKEVLVCYATSPVTGWIFSSVVPTRSLLDSVLRLNVLTALIALALGVAALLLPTSLSRGITKPVEQLVGALQQAGEGNFKVTLPEEGDAEMRYLTAMFNQMNEKIDLLVEESYLSQIRNKESEIMALNLQLNPHFLYNTLNIINMMALESDNQEISQMIVCLSQMLQYTFRNKQDRVPFEEEYIWLQNYVFIMSMRFEEQFVVDYQVDRSVYTCRLPKLLLQPLVENAIVHGLRQARGNGVLTIKASRQEGFVTLVVEDNGCGMTPEELSRATQEERLHIGIANTIRRIQLLYGGQGSFAIYSQLGEGTHIYITLPDQS